MSTDSLCAMLSSFMYYCKILFKKYYTLRRLISNLFPIRASKIPRVFYNSIVTELTLGNYFRKMNDLSILVSSLSHDNNVR